ncbi:voltage-gated potassium channel subunit beta-2 isoform X1 [Lepeophtheirus salmonis]|uniref:voltage-gated potassium channel subunit beta-2 isoform X1 n=1 Tax=Lepeophtheirus salmonis TaxID=72036 RepID=UPI001AE7B6E8|nr:voltage-gated potassium channel subunit beta-2-like isoform X1 [Lepeophtheirus salmonis]XP_040578395.1 voltage-gated potassium channel subunit beta-2-like isoform X1 [Lepeophtheirus salmonis]
MSVLENNTDFECENNPKIYRGKAPIASIEVMDDLDLLSNSSTHLSRIKSEMNNKNIHEIKYRHLGKSGLKVPNIGLGSIKVFNQDNLDNIEELVTNAFNFGINLFDISDPHIADRTEYELGRIIKKKGWHRKQFTICAKIFWHKSHDKALSRKEIIESTKQTLANLQLSYVDLMIVHKSDSNCPIDEIIRAFAYLINDGKIMYWGTARWSPVEIFETYSQCRHLGLIPPICELGEYHWFHREKVELYMAELYNKIGIGLMTWSPISFGLCLGKNDDPLDLLPKLFMKSQKYNKNMEILNNDSHSKLLQLRNYADKLGCTLSQLQVAWSVRNQTCQCVIISASDSNELDELIGSLKIISKLSPQSMEEIDKILCNKPIRPAMISTLQQRWATSGGLPPGC